MRIKHLIFVISAAAVAFSGCVKDGNFMKLTAEGFEPDNNAQKASVDGTYTYWVSGDKVRINHYAYTVSPAGNNQATTVNVFYDANHKYCAIYPSKVYQTNNNNSYTIKVPSKYYHRVENGRQVLDGLPMASYYSGASDPTELPFRHITAALTVRVKNDKAIPITLDKVEIINNQYQLAGNITFDISTFAQGSTPAISPNKTGVPDTVGVYFMENDSLNSNKSIIASGGYYDVQVPILPVGSDNSTFTINVYAHKQGSRYIFSRTTTSRNNSIGRACLGYAVAKYDAEQVAEDLFDSQVGTDGRNYFEIGTIDELKNLSLAMDSMWATSDGSSNYHHANYVVTSDIDMEGEVITPIHYYNMDNNERCYFDGQGHTISNFVASSVDENEPNCCGLFGKTSGDSITIRNLNIDNAQYDYVHVKQKVLGYDGAYATAVGGIYAVVDKAGIVIENCTVTNVKIGSVGAVASQETQTDFYASGLVGLVQGGITIRNCYVGSVEIDNSMDLGTQADNKKVLVDQFGAAIGRIDVGDGNGSRTYQKAGDNCAVVIVENFTYDQGSTPIVFEAGLKFVRYGGIIANITRGGKIILKNCRANNNVEVYKPTEEMYLGGLIGSNKASLNIGIYLDANCQVTGTFNNQAVNNYSSKFQIEPYMANGMHNVIMVPDPRDGALPSSVCTNTLTVTGKKSTFMTPGQTFPS